jgi:hypothetical protein
VRFITFQNAAASVTTLSYEAPNDMVITGFNTGAPGCVVSMEPDLTYAVGFTAPLITSVETRMRIINNYANGTLLIPVDKGQKLYAAFSATKGVAQLVVEDTDQLKTSFGL